MVVLSATPANAIQNAKTFTEKATYQIPEGTTPVIALVIELSLNVRIDANAKHWGTSETRANLFFEDIECADVRVNELEANAEVIVDFFWPDIPPTPHTHTDDDTEEGTAACAVEVALAQASTFQGTTVARWTSNHDAYVIYIEWRDAQGWHEYVYHTQELHGQCLAESNAFTGNIQGDCSLIDPL